MALVVAGGVVEAEAVVFEGDEGHVFGVDGVGGGGAVTIAFDDEGAAGPGEAVGGVGGEDAGAVARDVGGDGGGGEVVGWDFSKRVLTGVDGSGGTGRRILPGGVEHGPGGTGVRGGEDFGGGDACGVEGGLAVEEADAGFEGEVEAIGGAGADDAGGDARGLADAWGGVKGFEAVESALSLGEGSVARAADASWGLESDAGFELPVELIVRDSAHDDGGEMGGAAGFEVHAPAVIGKGRDGGGDGAEGEVGD